MLRNIYLYGYLAEKYGKVHRFSVTSIGEACRALEANFPGFRQDIKRDEKYFVANGDDLSEDSTLNDETIFLKFKKLDFHICPEISGAGGQRGGIFTAVLGAVLMVASLWVPPAGIAGIEMLSAGLVFNAGLMLFASGMLSALSSWLAPDYEQQEKPDERRSFLFDGPTNTTEQGGPVPLIYGRVIVGSTVISTALDVEDA